MEKLPFGKKNYQWMIIGLILLVTGFTIMSIDNDAYGLGFFGITLGPIVVVFGFLIEIFAILQKPEQKK